MADVTITNWPAALTQDDRFAGTERLAHDLRARGLVVDVTIANRSPSSGGRVEWTRITIASTMILEGVYDVARRVLTARHDARRARRKGRGGWPLGIVIYGPDGKQLKLWDTQDGEHGHLDAV